jgi:hypothetical protein
LRTKGDDLVSEPSPIVRVEFEYADGRIQRLTGKDAERWLTEVNGVVGAAQLRYGQPQISEYPWTWTKGEGVENANESTD